MNPIIISIILVPIIEIYLLIKIGGQLGAITTIFLIFATAIVGIYYAKYEGLNTLKSGFIQISKIVVMAPISAPILIKRYISIIGTKIKTKNIEFICP